MKQIKIFFLGIAFVAVFLTGNTTVSAQVLDDAWFQLSISTKGSAVDTDDGSVISKVSLKTTAYMHLIWNTDEYLLHVHSENGPGDWVQSTATTLEVLTSTEDNVFMPAENQWTIWSPDGSRINYLVSGHFQNKMDSFGGLSKTKLKILSAVIVDNLNSENEQLFGAIKMKAKMINEDALPF